MTFTRSGGQLGKPLTQLRIRESEFTADEAAEWDKVSRSGVLERGYQRSGFAGGDEYQYDLIVRRGEEERSMGFTEFDIPSELVELVRLLERRAEIAAN